MCFQLVFLNDTCAFHSLLAPAPYGGGKGKYSFSGSADVNCLEIMVHNLR